MGVDRLLLRRLRRHLEAGDLDAARAELDRLESVPARTEITGRILYQGDQVIIPVGVSRIEDHFRFTFPQGRQFDLPCALLNDELRFLSEAGRSFGPGRRSSVNTADGWVHLHRRWFGQLTLTFPAHIALHQASRGGKVEHSARLHVRVHASELTTALAWCERQERVADA